jgi:hypothetical protein
VRLRDYELNFTSPAMSRVGKKYEVQKGEGEINIIFGQIDPCYIKERYQRKISRDENKLQISRQKR